MKGMKFSKRIICYVLTLVFMISSMSNISIIVEASGVDNIVARADYLYNIKWTAQKDVNGWKNRESNKYIKGKNYRIPYGQPVSAGKYICWGVSVDSFYDAAMDKNSSFYSKRSKNGSAESVYYAMDCSAFVSYCWGLSSRTTTSNWSNLSVTSYGKCTKTNIQKLQKGDALNLSGSHIVLVTDVKKDDGDVTKIEITEQTPPQLKRTTYTVSDLATKYSSYTIYRYKNRDDVKALSKPSTPKITSVSSTADTEITIKWNTVSGADEYIINGRTAGGSYEEIAVVKGKSSYTHKGLKTGCLYWYKIKAKNDSGSSGWSEAGGAYTKPKTPTSSVSNSTTSSIKVNWTKDADGASNYELLARKCGEKDYTTVANKINGYTYIHTGLEAGTQYYYKIKAHNTENTSIVSQRSDDGYGFTKLKAPTVTAKTAKTVSLDWSRGTLNGDYTYTYRVRRMASGASDYMNVAVISSSSYKDNNLKPSTTYRYYIDVLRNGNYIVHSDVLTVTTNEQVAESISVSPKNVTLTEGDIYKLSSSVLPSDTNNKALTWTSSNTNVATVSSNGTITSKTKGTANITAKTSNGLTAVCTVTVESLQDNCSHSFGPWTITSQATCTSVGYKHRRCDICDKAEGENIFATGHNYAEEWTITKDATCTEYGERKHLCTVCGEPDSNTVESVDMIAHTCGEEWTIETEPTCSEMGLKFKTCSVCNEKCETEEIPAISHEYSDSWIIEQEATCQQEKVKYRSCVICGEKEYHYEYKVEHNYAATDVKDSTYTEEGYATYTCSYCGDSYTDIIPMLTNEAEIIVKSVKARAGQTIDITLGITNNPGLASAKLKISYDTNVLTLKKVTDAGVLGSTSHSPSLTSPYVLYWNNGSITENFVVDGTIATLTFSANKNATVGTYPINVYYDEDNILNVNMDSVDFNTVDGKVTIIGNPSEEDILSSSKEDIYVESPFTKEGDTNTALEEDKESTDIKNQIILTINQNEMQVFGNTVTNDVPPVIINDRTMLPARIIAESLGATVEWFNDERKVKITKGTLDILIFIGSDKAIVNDRSIMLDSPAFIKGDRTYLPVRFICEALGATVKWENESQKVIIIK